jgi:hypothetical protein
VLKKAGFVGGMMLALGLVAFPVSASASAGLDDVNETVGTVGGITNQTLERAKETVGTAGTVVSQTLGTLPTLYRG